MGDDFRYSTNEGWRKWAGPKWDTVATVASSVPKRTEAKMVLHSVPHWDQLITSLYLPHQPNSMGLGWLREKMPFPGVFPFISCMNSSSKGAFQYPENRKHSVFSSLKCLLLEDWLHGWASSGGHQGLGLTHFLPLLSVDLVRTCFPRPSSYLLCACSRVDWPGYSLPCRVVSLGQRPLEGLSHACLLQLSLGRRALASC